MPNPRSSNKPSTFRLWMIVFDGDAKVMVGIVKRLFKTIDILDVGINRVACVVTGEMLTPEEALEILETEAMVRITIAISRFCQDIESVPEVYKRLKKMTKVAKLLSLEERILLEERMHLPIFIYENLQTIKPQKNLLLEDDVLAHTARVFLQCNLNVTDASIKLYVHRNTLLYRLNRIQVVTGYDLRTFEDALNFQFLYLAETMVQGKGKNGL